MRVYAGTDIGQRRQVNQDYVYASMDAVGNLPNLFVVADGMGGHNAGDYASSCAVHVLVNTIKEDVNYNPVKIMRHGIEAANLKILEESATSAERKGMGTTAVVATVVGNYTYVANVGDSRLYVIHQGIRQVTRDHSLVQEMVRMGELKEEEAINHPDKNIITRAIGATEDVNADIFEVEIQQDEQILMCTDGLTNMVEDEEVLAIVRGREDLVERVEKLVERANENGGKDNITVIMIEPFLGEV